MANRVCEKCICYDVCLLHEDNFIDDVAKNGFCGKFKNKADLVEVKHGYWKMEYHETRSTRGRLIRNKTFTCSNCNRRNGRITTKYCSNCGAKMDERKDAE